LTQGNQKKVDIKRVSQAEKFRQNAIVVVAVLLTVLFAATVTLTIFNNITQGEILEESVKSELIATCNAARNEVDIDLLLSLNSAEDIQEHKAAFDSVIDKLRVLRDEVGATYIYVLKEVDGEYHFIFDTDDELGTPDYPFFEFYDLSPVHEKAFVGESSADIMNVEDEWGSFNTGAVPLYDQGKLVGIVSVDFEDTYIERSRQSAATNATLLIVVLAVTMGLLIWFLIYQTRRNKRINEDLHRVVNNDYITGLPNRYYFYSYFSERKKLPRLKDSPYALLFIDLDNFKNVNDSAGHDTGDELLRLIADFLRSYTDAYTGNSNVESMSARIGGDEFLQTLPGISTAEETIQYAQKVLEDFASKPEFQRFITDFHVGLSIGGALYPIQIDDFDEVVKLADIAMYHSKRHGKNSFVLYDASMGDHVEGEVLSVRGSRD
jgi:diguanylate cyclase (GGDEF)-like protein